MVTENWRLNYMNKQAELLGKEREVRSLRAEIERLRSTLGATPCRTLMLQETPYSECFPFQQLRAMYLLAIRDGQRQEIVMCIGISRDVRPPIPGGAMLDWLLPKCPNCGKRSTNLVTNCNGSIYCCRTACMQANFKEVSDE